MKYEVCIQVVSECGGWTTTDYFDYRPETDTVKALLAEAIETHIALYDQDPTRFYTTLKQVEYEDTVEQELSTVR